MDVAIAIGGMLIVGTLAILLFCLGWSKILQVDADTKTRWKIKQLYGIDIKKLDDVDRTLMIQQYYKDVHGIDLAAINKNRQQLQSLLNSERQSKR